jgi:cation diffusion facilitator family transporter
MSTEGGKKAVIAALLANMGIALTKFLAYFLTGASSMLAEAIHSVADSGNQLLLLLGGRTSKRLPTAQHPFGFGRDRYVYAFIVSIVLFSVGGLFALYEAYHKLRHVLDHPGDLGSMDGRWWWVPIAVLCVAILMEGFSFRTAIKESNTIRGKSSWIHFVRRSKSPELPVILLEDLAALLGLSFALLGVGLTLITRNPIFDVMGTTLIGVLLVVVAVVLGVETKSLLIGEAASVEAQTRISAALEASAGIRGIIHMRTLHLGPEELLVAAKIDVSGNDTAAEIAKAIDEAEASIRAAEPTARVIYLEPDLRRN